MNRRREDSYVTIADALGVGYAHLYRVLHLERSSPALLLTVERRYPTAIARQDASVRQSLLASCDFHRKAYRWDGKANRFVPKKRRAGK